MSAAPAEPFFSFGFAPDAQLERRSVRLADRRSERNGVRCRRQWEKVLWVETSETCRRSTVMLWKRPSGFLSIGISRRTGSGRSCRRCELSAPLPAGGTWGPAPAETARPRPWSDCLSSALLDPLQGWNDAGEVLLGRRESSQVTDPLIDAFYALAAELAERVQQELGSDYEVLHITPTVPGDGLVALHRAGTDIPRELSPPRMRPAGVAQAAAFAHEARGQRSGAPHLCFRSSDDRSGSSRPRPASAAEGDRAVQGVGGSSFPRLPPAPGCEKWV